MFYITANFFYFSSNLCPTLNRQPDVERLNGETLHSKGTLESDDSDVICFYKNPVTSELCCAKIPSDRMTLLTHANR